MSRFPLSRVLLGTIVGPSGNGPTFTIVLEILPQFEFFFPILLADLEGLATIAQLSAPI